MASAGAHLPPWDRGNVEQEGLFYESQYKEVLNKSCVKLRNNLRLADMWPYLRQMSVINQNDEERMRLNAPNCDSVDRLIAFLNTCQTWCYHALLRVMALTQQGHLIPPGGLPSAVYMEGIQAPLTTPVGPGSDGQSSNSAHTATGLPPQKQHFYKKVDSDVKISISTDLLPGLLSHCEVSDRMLMKAGLFGYHDDITIDITQFHICTDVKCELNREQATIKSQQLFNRLFQRHAPNTLLLEGEAGTGKSTYLQDYAHRHCKEFTECEQKGPQSPCLGHCWKLILYIPAGLVIGSQEAALREHLLCDDKHKDKIMAMVNNDGEGVLIMNDGLDELRKGAERESMRQYTISQQKFGTPKVINSSRTGLCHIEKKFFDRMVTLDGFTTNQGFTYVERYFKERSDSKTDNSALLDYIKQQKTELEWVLTNPLRVHIFSQLTVSGALTEEDIKTLTMAKLLKVLEVYVLKREEACRKADTGNVYSLEFYNLCLENFLKDERKLAEQSIRDMSPYKAFLNRHKMIDLYARERNYFMFGHEMLFESFSVQGLIEYLKSNPSNKKALLLCLCTDCNMRNALQLLCGYISEYEPDLHQDLVFTIQACLILQVEEKLCEKNNLTERLLQLPHLIKRNFTASTIYKGIGKEQAKMVMDICDEIQAAFNNSAEALRTAGWFCNYFHGNMMHIMVPTHHLYFITRCLRQCTPSLQEEVCSQTTHRLLPCVRYEVVSPDGEIWDNYIFAVSGLRWGEIWKQEINAQRRSIQLIHINAWCPSDILSALTQFYTHRNPGQPTDEVCFIIDFTLHYFMWGEPPDEVWVCEKWVCSLKEVLKHRPWSIFVGAVRLSGVRPIPLNGLITALQKVITPAHGVRHGIDVMHGQVSEEVLEDLLKWAHTINLRMDLYSTTVLLSGDRDQDYVTCLHQRVRHIMDTTSPPTYITPEGMPVKYSRD